MGIERTYLFVYGTLRKGFNSPVSLLIVDDIAWKGEGWVNGVLYDIGEYPGAVSSDNKDEIILGEIIEILTPEKVWNILDDYEGCAYVRSVNEVWLVNGELLNAWVYRYNLPVVDKRRIGTNDYLKYLQKKQLA